MILELVLVVHTIVAALWTGAIVLLSGAVIPAARTGEFGATGLALVAERFRYLTISAVLLLLFSGGHLAGTLYTVETLQGSGRGHLVLTMVFLWLVLAHLSVFGYRRLETATAERSVAEAATAARPWFLAGSVVSVVLLVVAGLL